MNITTSIGAGATLEFSELSDFFRLLASDAAVTVRFFFQGKEITRGEGISEGYSERFRVSQFDRLTITSATAQNIQFLTRLGNDVNFDAPPNGDVNVISVNNASLIQHLGGAATGSYKSVSAMGAGQVDTLFLPAANVNGAILLSAQLCYRSTAWNNMAFLSKSGTPTTVIDGDVLLMATTDGDDAGAAAGYSMSATLPMPQYIPPGQGLYFFTVNLAAGTVPNMRCARYRLL